MSDPTRWSASFQVRWSPMLTYERRRLALLQWFEDSLDVVEFSDDDQTKQIGISVGTPALRLTVSSTRLQLLLRSPDALASGLEDALAGVFEVLDPKDVVAREYRGGWSQEIEGDYDEVRARLSIRTTPDLPKEVATITDCAILADLDLPSGHAQIDYGIVKERELFERLTREMGRAGSPGSAPPRPATPPVALPPTSLFADVSCWPARRDDPVSEPKDLTRLLDTVESEVRGLVASLRAGL